MNWKEFLKPDIPKIFLTILIVAIISYFFISALLKEPWFGWAIAIAFWYLVSCLIVFGYKQFKEKWLSSIRSKWNGYVNFVGGILMILTSINRRRIEIVHMWKNTAWVVRNER